MDEAKQKKVAGLLQHGLELYGTGEVAKAFLVWNEVLQLDPGNEEALDYMRDADRRARPRSENRATMAAGLVGMLGAWIVLVQVWGLWPF